MLKPFYIWVISLEWIFRYEVISDKNKNILLALKYL